MEPGTAEFAHIGKSVIIKGELSGSEDLFVDGVVEGSIQLEGNHLVIGPNGKVHADVNAKGVVVEGKLNGNIHASERAQLRSSAVVHGDIFTQHIAIEDGAYLKGKVDIQRETKSSHTASPRSDQKAEVKSAAATATSASPSKTVTSAAATVPASTTVTNP
ncbi:MAG: polymer-forming cytoskeletal protein [Acidobacteriaceae bacterium]|nr:polymer-forming cytoskeletal protein [Acidobacteriaceae bacterium]